MPPCFARPITETVIPSRLPARAAVAFGVSTSESGERPPTGPEPELTPREARLREREARRGERPQGMVPGRPRRRTKLERGAMRLVATGGIIGIAVVLGAVLVGHEDPAGGLLLSAAARARVLARRPRRRGPE